VETLTPVSNKPPAVSTFIQIKASLASAQALKGKLSVNKRVVSLKHSKILQLPWSLQAKLR